MKLWKSLKVSISRTDRGEAEDLPPWGHGYQLDVFKSESSLSTDSGLCVERGVRRARVELLRPPGRTIGIKLAGRSEPGAAPSVLGFWPDSVALESDRLAPGDRICSVNGISTARLSNDEVLRLLDNVEERATLELEYYLPNYASQNSLYVTTKVAEVPVEKVNGSLGITLRGGVPDGQPADLVLTTRSLDARPLLVTHVRPGGAAYNTSRIKPGDRLLKVDHVSLSNKTLSEVHSVLQSCPQVTSLTIEYDVSVMESVKLATGPLLVEIERPCHEDLGLCLGAREHSLGGGVYIDGVLPASISDRCGALHAGDQLLAFDEHVVAGGYSAEEVACYLDNADTGYTRLHVLPRHLLHADSGRVAEAPPAPCGGGAVRWESLSVSLSLAAGEGAGLELCASAGGPEVSRLARGEAAWRSGAVCVRDRLVSVDGRATSRLSAEAASSLVSRRGPGRLVLGLQFALPDTVRASSGVYSVRLPRAAGGLGVTISGSKPPRSGPAPVVISDIRPGSAAHRCGALAVGDWLLAVDDTPLHDLSLDSAFNILQNSPDDVITLKIRKREVDDDDWSADNIKLRTFSTRADVHGGDDSGHSSASPRGSERDSERGSEQGSERDGHVFWVQLARRGPLGLTVAGSEDATQPILVSGLLEGGAAESSGELMVGDELLGVNGDSVLDKPLSEAIRLLQAAAGPSVRLQLCRKTGPASPVRGARPDWERAADPSAIEYAVPDKCRADLPLPDYSLHSSLKSFQYESACLPRAGAGSGTARGDAGHYEQIGPGGSVQQVILYKDAIYDDYGFSVSDGLYERGVYINRIRRGGPADIVGLLRPYDRILQVNGTRTVEYDCCLTVPLIAAAADRLELAVLRQDAPHSASL